MGKGGRDEREVSELVCHLNYVSTCFKFASLLDFV